MAEERNYEWFVSKLMHASKSNMDQLTAFKSDCPQLYERYYNKFRKTQASERGDYSGLSYQEILDLKE